MKFVTLEASPIDPRTASPSPVALCGGGQGPYLYGGKDGWLAGLGPVPLFQAALGFSENGWTGGAVPTTGDITFSPAGNGILSLIGGLYWKGQTVTLKVGDDSVPNPVLTTVLVAKVAAQRVVDGVLSLTVSDLSGDLVKPAAPDRFTGKGGIEGDSGVEGRSKRRSFGRVFNVEGMVLIAADNIYEFGDPARPLQEFVALRDKGRAADTTDVTVVAWQGSISATLAALRGATPRPGGGVVAPSIACAKWWTQPSGPLTADIRGEIGSGYIETAPEIAARIIETMSSLSVSNVSETTDIRAATAGIHLGDPSETAAGAVDRLLLGVSLLWVVRPNGTVRFSEWSFDAAGPSERDWSQGQAQAIPYVPSEGSPIPWSVPVDSLAPIRSGKVTRRSVLTPIKSRRIGYQRNYRQHTDGEISAAILANDVLYPDGRPVSSLQPAQAGADVTADNQTFMSVVPTITVQADYLGNVAIGQLPATGSFRRYRGGVDVSPSTSYSISMPAGIAATVNNTPGSDQRGDVTITGADVPNAVINVTSIYEGVALYGTLVFVRQDAGTAMDAGGGGGGGTGTPVSTSPNALPGNNAMPVTPAMTVTVGSGGGVSLGFSFTYTAQRETASDEEPATGAVVIAKWEYSADKVAWEEASSDAIGSQATNVFRTTAPKGVNNNPGSVSQAVSKTGLTAGATAYFRVTAYAQGVVISMTGTASATP